MNFNDPVTIQFITGPGCTILGICGWLLPWEWNVLRLHRGIGKLVPDKINRLIPKIVGTVLVVCGLTIIILTATVGKLD